MTDLANVADGATVTVKALWSMPGVDVGTVRTVTLGPHLRALICAGRYQLLGAAGDVPAAKTVPKQRSTADDGRAGDGADG